MADAAQQLPVTASEYLEMDRASDTRLQFMGGQVYAMAGGSPEHAAIILNLGVAVANRLRGKPCRPTSGAQRIHVPESGSYLYADLSVICGGFEYHPDAPDTLVNPTVLFKVLSPSTADFDLGTKFEDYKQLPSLMEYVVVSQDRRRVQVRRRVDDDAWLVRDFTGDSVALASIDVVLPLDEIYDLAAVRAD